MAHLKRLAAPTTWAIKRKGIVFITRQSPRTKSEFSIPMSVALRDLLKIADTAAEVRKILRERQVRVNGNAQTGMKFPLTLFDIVEIPAIGKSYAVTYTELGKLTLAEGHKANYRLLRVEKKTKVSGGKLQLNLFDGTNVLAPKDEYKVGDVVKLSVPENKIVGKLTPSEGAKALVIRGSHRGQVAGITSLDFNKTPKEVKLKNEEGEFLTRFDYIHLVE